MCGIAGIVHYRRESGRSGQVDPDILTLIREQMRNRGPDGAGNWLSADGRVGLAHRRLAIIDPGPGGHQPMESQFGSHVITYNGEIYNFRSLRTELKGAGYQFTSESDTEVLLALYQQHGSNMFAKLRGMFAIAIWDNQRQGLLLGRDPYGIKPLYYTCREGVFQFASQARALLAGGIAGKSVSPVAEASFLLTGSVMEPVSWYQDIQLLPAGNQLWLDHNGVGRPECFADIAALFAAENSQVLSFKESQQQVADALMDSTRHHLVADVPVGMLLSAGIDSGVIASIAAEQLEQPLQTMTLGFAEYADSAHDETVLARRVAASIGADHHERYVSRQEFEQDFPAIMEAMDQPSIDGINSWFVSKAVAELGLKVMLSGVGGDELFAGYPSFHQLPRWQKKVAWLQRMPVIGSLSTALRPWISPRLISPKAFALPGYAGTLAGGYLVRRGLFMPEELPELMGAERAREGLSQLRPPACFTTGAEDSGNYAAIAAMESSFYLRNQLLRDTDWASMAHSVELRTPLVDPWLTQAVAPLVASSPGKHWLSGSLSRQLPDSVTSRAKTGFTTPVGEWIKHSPALDSWKHHPRLCREGVHWSRRYAYCLQQRFIQA